MHGIFAPHGDTWIDEMIGRHETFTIRVHGESIDVTYDPEDPDSYVWIAPPKYATVEGE